MKQLNITKIILSGLLAGAINTATAQTTFNYTGSVQTYTVPSGVTSLTIDARGATGGTGKYGNGGSGGRVQCAMSVTPGQVLYFYVGGSGINYTSSSTVLAGGFNGGGATGAYPFEGSGGGASDIRTGGTALSNRMVVAAGGGGGSYNCSSGMDGGAGGGLTGDGGYSCGSKTSLCYCPTGGTQTGGGANGTCTAGGPAGLGVGNAGQYYGGAGGGGFYGGGGGYYAGGGGGSSYTDPVYVSAVTHTAGYNASGNGLITFTTSCPLPTVSPITGVPTICLPGGTTLADVVTGGVWSSSNTSIATVSSTSGVVTGVSAGTAFISYAVTNSCGTTTVTDTIYVRNTPTITTSTTTSCGNIDTLTASGGTTYTWYPASGLSCTSCATTEVNPSSTTTYTVMGTTLGCTSGTTITVNGDRIYGHINFSSLAPDTLDMKVWLIQYNPLDSSLTALDSTLTCTIDSSGYYEFNSKATGSYMVKAKMLFGSYAGASGYVPTYSSSTATWSSAATVAHAGGSDVLDIIMIYGTVPAGPGFIGGNVYSGAGKGTSGETLYPGMLIYLKDATTGKILTYTYSDAMGAYSFSGIANGSYIICPEEYQYFTTPSSVITLTPSDESIGNVNFKKHLGSMYTITPYEIPTIIVCFGGDALSVYPNPTTGLMNIQWQGQPTGSGSVRVTDIVGHEVYRSALNINTASGTQQVNLSGFADGVYMISVKSENINYSGRLLIQK